MDDLNFEKAAEEAILNLSDEFYRGAEALYHHLQATIIGFSGSDAISSECKRFFKIIKSKKKEAGK